MLNKWTAPRLGEKAPRLGLYFCTTSWERPSRTRFTIPHFKTIWQPSAQWLVSPIFWVFWDNVQQFQALDITFNNAWFGIDMVGTVADEPTIWQRARFDVMASVIKIGQLVYWIGRHSERWTAVQQWSSIASNRRCSLLHWVDVRSLWRVAVALLTWNCRFCCRLITINTEACRTALI